MMEFEKFMTDEGKAQGTMRKYTENVNVYKRWYAETFGQELEKLYRANILEYKSYLKNIKQLNAKTINAKLSAFLKYNEFLKAQGTQDLLVITKKDFIPVQTTTASPTTTTKLDVEKFRQKVLIEEGSRNYAICTVMAYAGLRISECLNLKMNDINTTSREIIVRSGKGGKQRITYMNDKIVEAIRSYQAERNEDGTSFLFLSNKGGNLDRSTINRMFNKYSDTITPHSLRHFFCTNALEAGGYGIHEVASLAGHSNIATTLIYTNPNVEKMKQKANLL